MRVTTFSIRIFCFLTAIFASTVAIAQEHGFPYGTTVTLDVLKKNKFELDTTAHAIVINEFGEAYFDSESGRLVVTVHKLIKILNKEGLAQGNFEIYLRAAKMNWLR
jgi:protein-disulfide isomerase-like protein with CxxC motif